MAFKMHDLKWRYGLGSWAVVTGASDGIGEQYSIHLASQGFNLVLISRTKSKLEAVKKKIMEKNDKIQVKIVVADFNGNANMAFYQKLKQDIGDINISLLILNAGVLYGGLLEKTNPKDMQATIDINIY